ncbi:MAG: c-type cytochrome [Saprospiraceae bacterium]|nr:c-type cytochrome [Saprospiraceae bacterium]
MKNLILSQFINPDLFKGGLLLQITPTPAEEPSAWMSVLTNPIAVIMIFIMIVLLFVIRSLTKVLLQVADVKIKRTIQEQKEGATKIMGVIALILLASVSGVAQDATTTAAALPAEKIIGGMSQTVFFLISGVIIIEAILIYVLLSSIKKMVTKTNLDLYNVSPETQSSFAKWWDKFNEFKPIEQEADIDLGHDYDGIRELDNRLPPWWLYGFYGTIIFALFYLWSYHVSHTSPSSQQEFKMAMDKAEKDVAEYLKTNGDNFNESNIKMLPAADIAEGANLFKGTCVACHSANGGGGVGPNLTDAYWLNGGDIKSVFKTIKYGIRAMPSWQNNFSGKQMAQLASYVESLRNTNVAGGKAPQGELFKEEAPTGDTTAVSTMTKSDTTKTGSAK